MTKFPTTIALIQAGGKGVRLRPYTYVLPKPMLPVRGVPLICGILDRIVEAGFTTCLISIGYLGSILEHALGNCYKGCDVVYLRETGPEGTIGSARLTAASGKHVLSINGDLILDFALEPLIQFHHQSTADITIATKYYSVEIPYGVLHRAQENQLARIEEKPTVSVEVCAGINLLSPKALSLIPGEGPCDMPELINMAICAGLFLQPFALEHDCIEISTVNRYHELALRETTL